MQQFGGKDSKRHFTVVMSGKEHGLYVSSTPSSAAKKAVTKLCAANKSKKVVFHIREITQGSKKKTYGPYLGHIEKLKEPIELKGRVIKYKPVAKIAGKKSEMKGGVSEFNYENGKLTSDAIGKMFENFKVENPENPAPFHYKKRYSPTNTFYFGTKKLGGEDNSDYLYSIYFVNDKPIIRILIKDVYNNIIGFINATSDNFDDGKIGKIYKSRNADYIKIILQINSLDNLFEQADLNLKNLSKLYLDDWGPEKMVLIKYYISFIKLLGNFFDNLDEVCRHIENSSNKSKDILLLVDKIKNIIIRPRYVELKKIVLIFTKIIIRNEYYQKLTDIKSYIFNKLKTEKEFSDTDNTVLMLVSLNRKNNLILDFIENEKLKNSQITDETLITNLLNDEEVGKHIREYFREEIKRIKLDMKNEELKRIEMISYKKEDDNFYNLGGKYLLKKERGRDSPYQSSYLYVKKQYKNIKNKNPQTDDEELIRSLIEKNKKVIKNLNNYNNEKERENYEKWWEKK